MPIEEPIHKIPKPVHLGDYSGPGEKMSAAIHFGPVSHRVSMANKDGTLRGYVEFGAGATHEEIRNHLLSFKLPKKEHERLFKSIISIIESGEYFTRSP